MPTKLKSLIIICTNLSLILNGDSIVSKKLYHKAITTLQKCPENIEKVKHHSYLLAYAGLSAMRRGNLSDALSDFEKGMKLAKKTNDYIQIIKFGYNIASLYGDAGNYKLAIKEARRADLLLDAYQLKIPKEKYDNNKSNINICIGSSYESFYKIQPQSVYLDSAKYYFIRAISFSANLNSNRIIAKSGLGNIYCYHENYPEAIKTYLSLFVDAKENNEKLINAQIYYNLAISYYNINNFDKSLIYFAKSDSINTANNVDKTLFLESNYYQAKIFEHQDNPKEAFKHAKIFIENYEHNEAKKSQERNEFNVLLEEKNLEKEMILVRDKFKNQVLLENVVQYVGIIGVPLLLLILGFNIYKKKLVERKIKLLLQEFENVAVQNSLVSAVVAEDEILKDTLKKQIPSI